MSKAIQSELFWPKSTNLILKYAKYQNLQTFESKIFKVKIVLSPELMTDIFELTEIPYSLRINSLFRPEDPNDKIWHRKRKI